METERRLGLDDLHKISVAKNLLGDFSLSLDYTLYMLVRAIQIQDSVEFARALITRGLSLFGLENYDLAGRCFDGAMGKLSPGPFEGPHTFLVKETMRKSLEKIIAELDKVVALKNGVTGDGPVLVMPFFIKFFKGLPMSASDSTPYRKAMKYPEYMFQRGVESKTMRRLTGVHEYFKYLHRNPETTFIGESYINGGSEDNFKIDSINNGKLAVKFDPSYPILHTEDTMILSFDNFMPYIRETLKELLFDEQQRSDFITHWLPLFRTDEFIAFRFLHPEEIKKAADLVIEPQPDVILRVFLLFGKVQEKHHTRMTDWKEVVGSDKLSEYKKPGNFRVLEWGGMQL